MLNSHRILGLYVLPLPHLKSNVIGVKPADLANYFIHVLEMTTQKNLGFANTALYNLSNVEQFQALANSSATLIICSQL